MQKLIKKIKNILFYKKMTKNSLHREVMKFDL